MNLKSKVSCLALTLIVLGTTQAFADPKPLYCFTAANELNAKEFNLPARLCIYQMYTVKPDALAKLLLRIDTSDSSSVLEVASSEKTRDGAFLVRTVISNKVEGGNCDQTKRSSLVLTYNIDQFSGEVRHSVKPELKGEYSYDYDNCHPGGMGSTSSLEYTLD